MNEAAAARFTVCWTTTTLPGVCWRGPLWRYFTNIGHGLLWRFSYRYKTSSRWHLNSVIYHRLQIIGFSVVLLAHAGFFSPYSPSCFIDDIMISRACSCYLPRSEKLAVSFRPRESPLTPLRTSRCFLWTPLVFNAMASDSRTFHQIAMKQAA